MKARCPRCGGAAKFHREACRCCGEVVEVKTCPYCGEFRRPTKKKFLPPAPGNEK